MDPERIRSLAKKYVAKYKGLRLRDTKTLDKSLADQVYSPTSQDMAIVFSPWINRPAWNWDVSKCWPLIRWGSVNRRTVVFILEMVISIYAVKYLNSAVR